MTSLVLALEEVIGDAACSSNCGDGASTEDRIAAVSAKNAIAIAGNLQLDIEKQEYIKFAVPANTVVVNEGQIFTLLKIRETTNRGVLEVTQSAVDIFEARMIDVDKNNFSYNRKYIKQVKVGEEGRFVKFQKTCEGMREDAFHQLEVLLASAPPSISNHPGFASTISLLAGSLQELSNPENLTTTDGMEKVAYFSDVLLYASKYLNPVHPDAKIRGGMSPSLCNIILEQRLAEVLDEMKLDRKKDDDKVCDDLLAQLRREFNSNTASVRKRKSTYNRRVTAKNKRTSKLTTKHKSRKPAPKTKDSDEEWIPVASKLKSKKQAPKTKGRDEGGAADAVRTDDGSEDKEEEEVVKQWADMRKEGMPS